MSCKYDIIDEGGRKRVRALRPFTVQGRDVCPMELGGYVYDANTLSQDGNCWIFSGSLEYPGVRVMDEAIVDMGNNLPKNNARPINFGCVVSPTAATAFDPRELTINESTSPANATKNDSIIAGTAIRIVARIVPLPYFFIMNYISFHIILLQIIL